MQNLSKQYFSAMNIPCSRSNSCDLKKTVPLLHFTFYLLYFTFNFEPLFCNVKVEKYMGIYIPKILIHIHNYYHISSPSTLYFILYAKIFLSTNYILLINSSKEKNTSYIHVF